MLFFVWLTGQMGVAEGDDAIGRELHVVHERLRATGRVRQHVLHLQLGLPTMLRALLGLSTPTVLLAALF